MHLENQSFFGFAQMQEGDFEMKHIDRVGSQSFNVAIAPFSLSILGDDTDSLWDITYSFTLERWNCVNKMHKQLSNWAFGKQFYLYHEVWRAFCIVRPLHSGGIKVLILIIVCLDEYE